VPVRAVELLVRRAARRARAPGPRASVRDGLRALRAGLRRPRARRIAWFFAEV